MLRYVFAEAARKFKGAAIVHMSCVHNIRGEVNADPVKVTVKIYEGDAVFGSHIGGAVEYALSILGITGIGRDEDADGDVVFLCKCNRF